MTPRAGLTRAATVLAAPVLAVAVAFAVTSLVLLAAGDPVGQTWAIILQAWQRPRAVAQVVNAATTLYLAALAVAIGFRMNLFNIGVEGQYRVAAFAAAVVGAELALPGPLHVAVVLLVAMAVGALWAGIAGLLKVHRGVSEVISTIMLNSVATILVAYLLRRVAVPVAGSNNIGTAPLPATAQVPAIPLVPESPIGVYGLIVVAVAAGIAYSVLVNRTRFGFDLRAAGMSRPAAVASGVDVRRMVLWSMLLSGAVAGLVGMPILLGEAYTFSNTFQAGLGFAGIAVALLGRNHPLGIGIGALLFAYLDVAANPLQIQAGVAIQIVQIMQGVIVLAVVIAYEVIRRYALVQEQRRVARELAVTGRPSADRQEVAA
ncbi:MAG: ABC transporter permease [Actinomycetota bacterium]|nr:ABC transporter permease [Actinomycetota bacterium]